MTRKHYVMLAHVLHSAKPTMDDPAAFSQWEKDCGTLAYALSQDNPRFDRERFVTACETGAG
jgi:hypothetical protein